MAIVPQANRKKIVIVGGGSAGWMTAAYLSKAFSGAEILLIESETIHTVGVGEATFSDIHLVFEFLGLKEEDWMPQCNASYKLAIRFVNWNAEKRPFYHPFQRFEIVEGRRIIDWWLKYRSESVASDYACFVVPWICDAHRSPRYLDGRSFDSRVDGMLGPSETGTKPVLIDDLEMQYPYAYHFDANLLGKFMRSYAEALGVKRLVDNVVDVPLTETGSIRAVRTAEHGDIAADLFVDCTGFRGLLINKALKEEFISFQESLPCDRAIAIQVPGDARRDEMEPFTTATALSAGWVWKIPLAHRIGTGYVYSSAFLSPDEAETEFRRHLGDGADSYPVSHIRMRVGRCRRSWVKNCVAIGLSSGFVEPLESTGIFFIQNGIEQLVTHFQNAVCSEEMIDDYNQSVAAVMDGVREFLTLHYVASSRADTAFWKATKQDLIVPDALRARLKLWRKKLPTKRDINPDYHGFAPQSYCSMLLGLGWTPEKGGPEINGVDDKVLAAFRRIRADAELLVRTLPSLGEYLDHKYRGTGVLAQGAD